MPKRCITVNAVGAIYGSVIVFDKIVVTEINLFLIVIPIQQGLGLYQLYIIVQTLSLLDWPEHIILQLPNGSLQASILCVAFILLLLEEYF